MSAPVAVRSVTGPVTVFAWAVAVGWFVLATVVGATVPSPANVAGAAVAAVFGVATGWLAASLGVRVDADGLRVGRAPRIAWDDVAGLEVGPGRLTLPVASVRRGRALVDVSLDGLAGPAGLARRLAQQVADAGELGPVGVRDAAGRGSARRALGEPR